MRLAPDEDDEGMELEDEPGGIPAWLACTIAVAIFAAFVIAVLVG